MLEKTINFILFKIQACDSEVAPSYSWELSLDTLSPTAPFLPPDSFTPKVLAPC